MPFRYPEVILHDLLDSGAVLTLETGTHERTFVIAPEHLLLPQKLVYYVVLREIPEGVHILAFQRMIAVGEKRIEFYRGQQRVAFIVPLEDADELSQITWRSWEHYRADHEVVYYEAITAELRAHDPEA